MEFPLRGPVGEVIAELVGGLRSGMSYLDSETVEEFWSKAQLRAPDRGGPARDPSGVAG